MTFAHIVFRKQIYKGVENMLPSPIGILTYTIQPGDSYWLLAQRHHTNVDSIVAANPRVNPNHLLVGQVIGIPFVQQPRPVSYINNFPATRSSVPSGISISQVNLMNVMRMLWEQHVAWTRMLIISIAADLPDEDLVTKRLLRNVPDMAAVFKHFYGDEIANEFSNLMTDHLVFAAQLVKAAKNGDQSAAADAEKKWYANADDIATFLNRINPYWSKEMMRAMMYEHLNLTKSEAVSRLTKDYATDIATYDKIEQQALEMADTFTDGIVKQFPDAFRSNY